MAPKSADLSASLRGGAADWTSRRERGSTLPIRVMVFLSCRLGRRASRIALYFIATYFCLFAPTARRHSRAYLRRALGREPRALDHFRHVLTFAATIHDRVYLANGRFDLFDISTEGEHCVKQAVASGQGALLMGAHVGSFEVIRIVGLQQPGLRVSMAMYEENTQKVNKALHAINPAAKPDVIVLGRFDAMLRIREQLEQGALVGILGDRSLSDGAAQSVSFLDAPAHLPVSSMRAAAALRRPVIFMLGLYRGGNRYHVVFEPLADFSDVTIAERAMAVRQAIDRYAALLEKYCRSDPYNWFNFFDFWRPRDCPPGLPPRR